MDNKDFLELKKRFKKNECTINRIYTCYVNAEGEKICSRDENFLVMKDDKENDFYKFLDLQKKTLSMKSMDLDFSKEKNEDARKILEVLYKNELKDKEIINLLIDNLIETYLKCVKGNFLITLVCDSYDVPTKTTDGMKLDESEEVYQYIICSICPVATSKAGLGYLEKENTIASRYQDWIVNPPEVGFIYPSFTNRSSDNSTITYLTKSKDKLYNYIMEETLNCSIEIPEETPSIEITETIEEFEPEETIKEEKDDVSKENIENEPETTEIEENNDFNNEENSEEVIEDLSNEEIIEFEQKEIIKEELEEELSEQEEMEKFFRKINEIIDENKQKAEIQIINGKRFLMIPME